MIIYEIIVSAGRTFNDPYKQFSNYRPSVTLKATVTDAEDKSAAVFDLQTKAENLVESHKKRILAFAKKKADRADEIWQKENELRELKRSDDDIPF